MEERSRADVISASLANRSGAVLTRDLEEAVRAGQPVRPRAPVPGRARPLAAGRKGLRGRGHFHRRAFL
jgi:hypothetical protein